MDHLRRRYRTTAAALCRVQPKKVGVHRMRPIYRDAAGMQVVRKWSARGCSRGKGGEGWRPGSPMVAAEFRRRMSTEGDLFAVQAPKDDGRQSLRVYWVGGSTSTCRLLPRSCSV